MREPIFLWLILKVRHSYKKIFLNFRELGLTVKQQASQRIETYSKDEQAHILSICDEEVPKIALKPSGEKTNSNLSSKKAIVEKWLTQSVEEIEDSESSRESQTSIFDDLKTLRDENIKVNS